MHLRARADYGGDGMRLAVLRLRPGRTRGLGAKMRAPAGFQRWPLIWFRCPGCRHHAYAAIAQIGLPLARRSLFRFWCERCGSLSVLKGPAWLPGVLALCAVGVSFLALLAVLELLPQQSDVAVYVAFPVFLITWAALNRLANRYVRENVGPSARDDS